MALYSRVIFPRLCDLFLNKPFVARHRRELLASVQGDILELGLGTGLNLPCYPPTVRKITAIEPNAGMNRRARKRMEQTGISVDQRLIGGERLPFDDNSFDCVVSTFTLCSIAGIEQALSQVYRVLRPGGRFLFLEHGISAETGVRKWQARLNWLEKLIADGCHLDRNIKQLIAGQPFQSVDIVEFYLEKTPRTHGYMYRGIAAK